MSKTLEDLSITNQNHVPPGWAPRVLRRAGIPFYEIFNELHRMYESQVPPYHIQVNVQALTTDMSLVLVDWLNEVTQPGVASRRSEFPADAIQMRVEISIREVAASNAVTKMRYDDVYTIQKPATHSIIYFILVYFQDRVFRFDEHFLRLFLHKQVDLHESPIIKLVNRCAG